MNGNKPVQSLIGNNTMKVKELIEKLQTFDPDLEIDFEFEEYSADGGTWLLEPGVLMKFTYDKENRDALIFNFVSVGQY